MQIPPASYLSQALSQRDFGYANQISVSAIAGRMGAEAKAAVALRNGLSRKSAIPRR